MLLGFLYNLFGKIDTWPDPCPSELSGYRSFYYRLVRALHIVSTQVLHQVHDLQIFSAILRAGYLFTSLTVSFEAQILSFRGSPFPHFLLSLVLLGLHLKSVFLTQGHEDLCFLLGIVLVVAST